jgi:cytosine/adenosine deaminase-related metal-dependent hydrolase
MRCSKTAWALTTLGLGNGLAQAASTLFSGGTIVAFDKDTESLKVIRDGSVLVTDDRIAAVSEDAAPGNLPSGTTKVDVTGQIITPGFVDTHRHGWQTAFKTIASNTTLAEYIGRYGEFAAAASFEPEDVYLGQLTGLYESLNGGVTTSLDHAHHTWSNETAYAGLNASIESGARVFWAYTFHNITSLNYTIADQFPNFRDIAESAPFKGTPTELGVSFDSWGPNPNVPEAQQIVDLIREYNVSVLTTHTLGGPWGYDNLPSDLHAFGILNDTVPVVFSHASFITANDVQLLRSSGQYISITPESEMHYGHTHPHSYITQDQAALGVDTHFTFSADILTQARIWLQHARYHFFDEVLSQWNIASRNPMSVNQAFLLATRAGGQALRRDDIGVIAEGAKADLVVWDAKNSPSLLGWVDPVAAVMLHASVGDVLHVLVDGKFAKRDGKLVAPNYANVRKRFLKSAKKIQDTWREMPYPPAEGEWLSGAPYEAPRIADVVSGEGNGYGQQFLD